MKGISVKIEVKTEAETDYKNYVIGDSRGPVRIDKRSVYFNGFNQGDMIFVSYHVKWKGVDWGKYTGNNCFETDRRLSYKPVGPNNKGAESGEMDVVVGPWKIKSGIITETDQSRFYSQVGSGFIKVASDGYIELTNIMIGKGDKVQPYIDSDELKAMGGEKQ